MNFKRLRVVLLLLIFGGSVFMGVGCQRNKRDAMVTTCSTLEEYKKAVETEYIPDSFIYYEDISFVGDFSAYRGEGTNEDGFVTIEKRHTVQCYEVHNGNVFVNVKIMARKTPKDAKEFIEKRNPNVEKMPERENFYPDYRDDNTYEYEGIYYDYRVIDLESVEVMWQYGRYVISLSVVNTWLWNPPDKDAYIFQLLHPDTAVEAKEQMNQAICDRQLQVTAKKAVSVAIPVVCFLAVGIPTLVIYCRKKRRIRTQKEQGESNLE